MAAQLLIDSNFLANYTQNANNFRNSVNNSQLLGPAALDPNPIVHDYGQRVGGAIAKGISPAGNIKKCTGPFFRPFPSAHNAFNAGATCCSQFRSGIFGWDVTNGANRGKHDCGYSFNGPINNAIPNFNIPNVQAGQMPLRLPHFSQKKVYPASIMGLHGYELAQRVYAVSNDAFKAASRAAAAGNQLHYLRHYKQHMIVLINIYLHM